MIHMYSDAWLEKNQKYLVENLNKIEIALEKFADATDANKIGESGFYREDIRHDESSTFEGSKTKSGMELDQLPALETICKVFGLSSFERNILLLCAGVELKSNIANLCAMIHGNNNFPLPTFGLVLAFFADAHWNALAPTSPLRYFRLISIIEGPNIPITKSPIKIDEKILHYLIGVKYIDRQLILSLVKPVRAIHPLPAQHKGIVDSILDSYNATDSFLESDYSYIKYNGPFKSKHYIANSFPCINLYGNDEIDKLSIARSVCSRIGLDLWKVDAESLAVKSGELENITGLWSREAILHNLALYVIVTEDTEGLTKRMVTNLLSSNQIPKPVFLSTTKREVPLDLVLSFDVTGLSKEDQYDMWKEYSEQLNLVLSKEQLNEITDRYDFSTADIISALDQARLYGNSDHNEFLSTLYESSGSIANARVNGLATCVRSSTTLKEIVLPSIQKSIINSILIHMKHRKKVYKVFGFATKTNRGLGITALFAGDSGTGKTMAAEVIANELNLDLLKIDLSMVISKYIGETEKNLSKLFGAAESSNAVLFFDEADALFGKRSEVRDSHDRYANIELAYLLQKMEEYRGLAILATNMKTSIDTAFIRRIRFIVRFPFPDQDSRAEIWRGVFPKLTPIKGIDVDRLAKLNIAGGTIRNIALNAAFLAAEEGVEVNMGHLRDATRQEYEKMERPLTQQELGALEFNL